MSLANRTRRRRIAALCGLLALVASIISSSLTQTAEAHGGQLFCGTAPFGGNTFQYEYTTWDEWPHVNWHVWDPYYEQNCGTV